MLQCPTKQAEIMKQDLMNLLQLLRNELGEALEGNLEQIVMYGSRARGDETPDSDLDILLVLKDASPGHREKAHQIVYRLMWDRGFDPLISMNIIDREYYLLLREAGSSYLQNILHEGKPLWP
jgi:predicted nucleotidyltransferase